MTYGEMKKLTALGTEASGSSSSLWETLQVTLCFLETRHLLLTDEQLFANAVHTADAQSAISASKFAERTVLADAAVATEKLRDGKYQSQLCAKTTQLFDLPRPRLFTSFTIPCDEQPDWCTARSQLPLHVSPTLVNIFIHVPLFASH